MEWNGMEWNRIESNRVPESESCRGAESLLRGTMTAKWFYTTFSNLLNIKRVAYILHGDASVQLSYLIEILFRCFALAGWYFS